MTASEERVAELVSRPQESLGVELKSWIDPQTSEGKAKVARACLALRNNDGGFLLIGFDDKTSAPISTNGIGDVRASFHADVVQGIVSKYASEPFEIHVHYPLAGDVDHPVIEVVSGVRTPVVAKADLRDDTGRRLILKDRVYVRSLASNGLVSSTEATSRDWGPLLTRCFENREADIGRFVRRHLIGLDAVAVESIGSAFAEILTPKQSSADDARTNLEEGHQRYEASMAERSETVPPHGAFEVSAILSGGVPHQVADKPLLSRLAGSNPQLTGWPMWLDSRNFENEPSRPRQIENGWEALVWERIRFTNVPHFDFWRIDPRGRLYSRRAFDGDLVESRGGSPQGTLLDYAEILFDTTDAIAVALAFLRELASDVETQEVAFSFRWSQLTNRRIGTMILHGRQYPVHGVAHHDTCTSELRVPLSIPNAAIPDQVAAASSALFAMFDGAVLPSSAYSDLCLSVLERRL